jgi:hypothetical protein
LQFEWHITDFVEEQRATIRQLKPPRSLHIRTSEGAPLMAKKFALKQRSRNRSAV